MSTFDNENIDRLFDSLEEHSIAPDVDQFGDMEVRLENMRYFRFGWKHFNIYYTIFIALSFLTSVGLLIDRLTAKPVQPQVVVVKDSAQIQPPQVIVQPSSPAAPQIIYVYKNNAPVKADTAKPAPAPVAPPVIIHDTVVVAPAPPKPRKVVVIPKRDTIIKYDTTKVIKRK